MYLSPENSSSAKSGTEKRASSPSQKRLGPELTQGRAGGVLWRGEIIRLLKDALIKELVCVVRYKHLSEDTRIEPLLSMEFHRHAQEELTHAQRLAQRIALLGGDLDYMPHLLMGTGRGAAKSQHDMKSLIRNDLAAEYRTIARYAGIISQVDSHDDSTRRLLEEIVSDERAHAEELNQWLVN